jgi:hypothetical protein
MDEKLYCCHCGDVIGAYEPMVALIDGQGAQHIRLAEADSRRPLGDCYHRACYKPAHTEPAFDQTS